MITLDSHKVWALYSDASEFITERSNSTFSIGDFETSSLPSVESDEKNINFAEFTRELSVKAMERHVFDLLNEGKYEEVRNYLEEMNKISSPLLNKWKKAFCRTIQKRTGRASLDKNDIKNDSETIKTYKNKYASKWVALKSGRVIDANESLDNLRNDIKRFGTIDKVTFLKL